MEVGREGDIGFVYEEEPNVVLLFGHEVDAREAWSFRGLGCHYTAILAITNKLRSFFGTLQSERR
jgi:hypothetical protein